MVYGLTTAVVVACVITLGVTELLADPADGPSAGP